MASRLGSVFVEISLDDKVYKQKLSETLTSTTATAKGIETAWKALGVKSDAIFNAQSLAAQNAYTLIKNSATSTANDIIRAEEAKNAKLKSLNDQQFGHQTSLLESLKKNWMAVSATIVASLYTIRKAWDLAGSAADYQERINSLDALGKKYGMTGKEIVAAMKEASRGLLGMRDAADMAAKSLNLSLSPTQMIEFTRVSEQLTDVIGGTIPEAFERMTVAAASGRTMTLAQMGIIVDLDAAYKIYAQTLGRTKDELNEVEKQQIRLNVILDAAKVKVAGLGDPFDTTRDKMDRFEAKIEDLKLTMGEGLIIVVDAAYRAFQYLAAGILGLVSAYARYRSLVYEVMDNEEKAAANREVANAAWAARNELVKKAGEAIFLESEVEQKASTQYKETAEVAKKASQEKEQATKSILEAIRKANYEIEGIGKTQYDKDIARIESEAEKYRKAGVDKVTVARYVAFETILATEKAFEVARETAKKAAEKETAIELELFKIMEDAKTKYFKEMADDRAEYEKWKHDEYIEDMRESYKLSQELREAWQQERDAPYKNIDRLAEEASYYKDLIGFEQTYHDKVMELIEARRFAEISAAKDTKTEYQDVIAAIAAANAKAQQAKNDLAEKMYDKESDRIEKQWRGYSDMFEGISELYGENTRERKIMHDAAMAFEIAEKAVMAGRAIVAAVQAIATQGSGDPYTAFARIAAMIALMAGVLASAGISFGGGGGASTVVLPPSTVLGFAPGTGSESVSKIWELLEDTYTMEYRELHGIYESMKELNRNITGLVASIIQTGGVGAVGGFGVTTGVEMGWAQGILAKHLSTITSTAAVTMAALLLLGKTAIGSILGVVLLGIPVIGWIAAGLGIIFGKTIGNWISSIFGGKTTTTVTATGIELGEITVRDLIAGMEIGVRAYVDIHKRRKGGWFSSDKDWYWTEYQAVGEDITLLFTKVFKDLGTILVDLAKGLGTDTQAALDYIFPTVKINLQGLDAEAINKTLSEFFSATGDVAAKALFGMYQSYQKVGEGFLETAARLVIDKEIVLDTLKMTGQAFVGTIPEIIAFSETIIAMAGDLETLREAAEKYYDAFFTDAEKQARLQGQLTDVFTDMNLVLPDARAGYRQMLEGLDLTTEAGQRAYVMLLQLAEGADIYYAYLEEIANKRQNLEIQILELTGDAVGALAAKRAIELASMDASLRPLQERIYALQDEAEIARTLAEIVSLWISIKKEDLTEAQTALRAAFEAEKTRLTDVYNARLEAMNINLENTKAIISELQGSVDKLRSAKERMRLEDTQYERNQYRVAQAILAYTLQQARMGDLSGVKDIDKTLDTLTGASTDLYSSFVDYQRDYWKTYLSISELEDLTGNQLKIQKQAEDLLEEQIDILKTNHDAELLALDAQMNALLNINIGVLSIVNAIEQLRIATIAVTTAATTTATGGMYYQKYLGEGGFASDEAYAAEIKRKLEGHISFVDPFAAEKFMRDHPELFAAGGSFAGGWRTVGEQGPELEYTGPSLIYSNPKSKALINNEEVTKEIRALRADLQRSNLSLVKNVGKCVKFIERWDGDGIPDTRTTV